MALGSYAAAETLTGTVTNKTTNKPAAGDEVVLIKLANGMEEAARTKADADSRAKSVAAGAGKRSRSACDPVIARDFLAGSDASHDDGSQTGADRIDTGGRRPDRLES